jgi:hypothetical protein
MSSIVYAYLFIYWWEWGLNSGSCTCSRAGLFHVFIWAVVTQRCKNIKIHGVAQFVHFPVCNLHFDIKEKNHTIKLWSCLTVSRSMLWVLMEVCRWCNGHWKGRTKLSWGVRVDAGKGRNAYTRTWTRIRPIDIAGWRSGHSRRNGTCKRPGGLAYMDKWQFGISGA